MKFSALICIEVQKISIEVIDGALLSLKSTNCISTLAQRNLQITFNPRFELSGLDSPQLKPNPQIKLHLNLINPSTLLFIEILKQFGSNNQLLSLKHRVQNVCGFVALVKWGQSNRTKPLTLVKSSGFNAIIVDADLLVGVSDGEVQSEVIMEVVVGGEVELCERGICYVELDSGGADYEPEDEEGYSDEDDCGEDELEDETEDAAAAAPEGTSAAAGAVVGLFCRD